MFVLLTCGIVFQLIVLTFLLLLPSNRQLNRLILVSFYSAMTTELVLAELLCCDCVFCNSLVFYVSTFYFILWAAVSAAYSALLSSSYFERINDDDDKPSSRLPLLAARPAVALAILKRAATILLLGEQRHDGCEQFA